MADRSTPTRRFALEVPPRVLLLDNFDSFTYNLSQLVQEILLPHGDTTRVDVRRNNEIAINEIADGAYQRIIISPGPGSADKPGDFGICGEVINRFGSEIPILGVCLGMQGIACAWGGSIVRAKQPVHGKTSLIEHDGLGVFRGIASPAAVMRYHSLVVDPESLSKELMITAWTCHEREVMGLRHVEWPLEGVQFHPESFATPEGKTMISNFLFADTAEDRTIGSAPLTL